MKKLLLSLCFTFGTYFSLIAQVPGCATLTTPADMATNVPVASGTNAVTLAWTAPTTGGAPTGYKIRWGTTVGGMTVLGTTPNLTVSITNVSLNTVYYWQALPTNATGDATGCTIIFSFTTAATVTSQPTTCLTGDPYPTATYTPATCNGTTPNTVATDTWAGEYSNINVIAGQTYRFQSSVVTDFIKISTTAAPTVIAASGTTPVTWTATATEIIKFYIHTDNVCTAESTNRVRSILCGATLKVESFDSSVFSISPNPANDFINISNTENIKVSNIKITDLNGRVVKQNNFDNVSSINLNVSDLSSGVYMMNINTNEGMMVKKIIKN